MDPILNSKYFHYNEITKTFVTEISNLNLPHPPEVFLLESNRTSVQKTCIFTHRDEKWFGDENSQTDYSLEDAIQGDLAFAEIAKDMV